MTQNGANTPNTDAFRKRVQSMVHEDHFRLQNGWWMSSVGLGTYLGKPDDATDRSYQESILRALDLGCNMIDAAVNYRFQRSERNIANALQTAFEKEKFSRGEIVISTKGGFLTFDENYPANPGSYFEKEYFSTGILSKEDVVAGCHAMTPRYLEDQLDRSLRNLNLDCVDIYFIHNPETQLSEISRQEFLKRILAVFKMLEEKVKEKKIQVYGVATWDGFRVSPSSRSYLSLEELIGLARAAGGEDHHFRAIQLPFNLAMPEGLLSKNQKFGSESVSVLEAARNQNLIVLASASILQGRLSSDLPKDVEEAFQDLKTDAQRSIQFVRSAPGVTTALVGMSQLQHVESNLELARYPSMPWSKLQRLLT